MELWRWIHLGRGQQTKEGLTITNLAGNYERTHLQRKLPYGVIQVGGGAGFGEGRYPGSQETCEGKYHVYRGVAIRC